MIHSTEASRCYIGEDTQADMVKGAGPQILPKRDKDFWFDISDFGPLLMSGDDTDSDTVQSLKILYKLKCTVLDGCKLEISIHSKEYLKFKDILAMQNVCEPSC